MITKELLEARRKGYLAEVERLIKQTAAFSGAADDCTYWILELESAEQQERPVSPDGGPEPTDPAKG